MDTWREDPSDSEECTHDIRGQEWREVYNDFTGEMEGDWYTTYESTCEDISLHAWSCTQCGFIGHY